MLGLLNSGLLFLWHPLLLQVGETSVVGSGFPPENEGDGGRAKEK